MYSKSGVLSYQKVGVESAVMSADPHQLIVMLFDGALSALVRARLFLEQGDVFRFVLTAQAKSQFSSQTAQSFTGRVNNVPVAFYGFWFSCKSFH